ncbi:MAG: hypothetical protein ACRECH_09680 [Nitrososphaerales archaeon]
MVSKSILLPGANLYLKSWTASNRNSNRERVTRGNQIAEPDPMQRAQD